MVDSNDRSKCSGHVNYAGDIAAWYMRRSRLPTSVRVVSDQSMIVSLSGKHGHCLPTEGASEMRVKSKKGGSTRVAVTETARWESAMAEEGISQVRAHVAGAMGVPEKTAATSFAVPTHPTEIARRVTEVIGTFTAAAQRRYFGEMEHADECVQIEVAALESSEEEDWGEHVEEQREEHWREEGTSEQWE